MCSVAVIYERGVWSSGGFSCLAATIVRSRTFRKSERAFSAFQSHVCFSIAASSIINFCGSLLAALLKAQRDRIYIKLQPGCIGDCSYLAFQLKQKSLSTTTANSPSLNANNVYDTIVNIVGQFVSE